MVLATTHQQSSRPSDKKRHGHHHKVSKHYAKTYWPYLPMLLIVLLGFFVNTTWSSGKSVLGYATGVTGSALLQDTNIQRSQNGRSALVLNNLLSQAAQQKADDMAARNYWSHTSPEGTQPWQVIGSVGYAYITAGENLAYGFDSSASTVSGWMNSPAHRANVLGVDYKEVGFGIANASNYQEDGEQTIIVAMYASPKIAVAPAAQPAAPKPPTTAAVPAQTTPAQATAAVPAPTPSSSTATPQTQDVATPPNAKELPSKEIARVDILTTGNAQWITLATIALATIGVLSFIYRHMKMWRKFLVRGEAFVIHHPFLDIFIVAVGVVGFLLTRTSGFIH